MKKLLLLCITVGSLIAIPVHAAGFFSYTLSGNTITMKNTSATPDWWTNEHGQQVQFIRQGNTSIYVTGSYLVLNMNQSSRSGTTQCNTAIRLDNAQSSGGRFIGVAANNKGVEHAGCTETVRAYVDAQNIIDPTVLSNSSQDMGEEFFGVHIPTCTMSPQSSSYVTCLNQRNLAINRAEAAIPVSTNNPQDIARYNSYKAVITCLRSSESKTVAACQASSEAQAIIGGDLGGISGDMTDEDIENICNQLSDRAERTECITKATTERDRLRAQASEATSSNCNIEGGLGWFLCPIMNTLAAINDGAYHMLSYLLESPPLMMLDRDGDQTGAYRAWAVMRNFANVLFIIFFLVIVFSQITSIGITNYGIKKLLPKLIVGAILINTSFFIVALAVDMSNVLGKNLYAISTAIVGTIAAPPGEISADPTPTWQYVVVVGLIGGTALGVGIMAGLAVILPLAVSAIVFVGGLVVALTFRNALVIILAVMAPLALVAYLLPNTEGMAKTWWTMFKGVLLLFPAVAIVMGMSKVAANVVWQEAVANDEWVMMAIATAMPMMGIIFALVLAKTMGSIASRFGIKNPLGGAINTAKSKAKGAGEAMRDGRRSFLTDRANKARATGKRRAGIYGLAGGGAGRAWQSRKDAKKAERESREAIYSESGGLGGLEKGYQESGRNSRIIKTAAENATKQGDLEQFANSSNEDLDKLAGGSKDMRNVLEAQRSSAISQAAAGLSSEYNSMDAGELGKKLAEVIKDGDSVRTEAIANKLGSMGGAGAKQLRSAYTEVEGLKRDENGNAVGNVADLSEEKQLRAYQQLNSSIRNSGVKAKAADVYSHAVNNGMAAKESPKTIQSQSAEKGAWESLSDAEVASQTDISGAIDSKAITPQRAHVIINSDAAKTNANPDTIKVLTRLAEQYRPTPQATQSSGPVLRGGETTTDSGLIIPRGSNQ